MTTYPSNSTPCPGWPHITPSYPSTPTRPVRVDGAYRMRLHAAIFTATSNWPVKIVYLCPGRKTASLDWSCDPFPELSPNKARCLKFSRRRGFCFVLSLFQDGRGGCGEIRQPCLCSGNAGTLAVYPVTWALFFREEWKACGCCGVNSMDNIILTLFNCASHVGLLSILLAGACIVVFYSPTCSRDWKVIQ